MVNMEKVETKDDIPVNFDAASEELGGLLEAILEGNTEFHTSDTSVVTVGYGEFCEFQDAFTRVDVLTSLVKSLKSAGAESININIVADVLGMNRL